MGGLNPLRPPLDLPSVETCFGNKTGNLHSPKHNPDIAD